MTMTFTATFGVHAGYGQHTAEPNNQQRWVSACIHRSIEYTRDASPGVVVGCVVTPARVFYPAEFGCPPEGETVIVVTGAHNPQFSYADHWRDAVEVFVEHLKDQLRQERVTLTFSECSTVYLEPELPASDNGERG
jgi:hypothetical protein